MGLGAFGTPCEPVLIILVGFGCSVEVVASSTFSPNFGFEVL